MSYRNKCMRGIWVLTLAALVFAFAGYLAMAVAEETTSLTLTMNDDNKTVTSTIGSSGSADISWETENIVSKTYRLEISGVVPGNASASQLTVKLAEGMRFAEEAADLSDVVTLVGSSPNTLPEGYTISNEETEFKNTGSRTYAIQEGITSFTVSVPVAQHELFRFNKIDNAMEVTLTYQQGGQPVSTKAVMHVSTINMINGVDKQPGLIMYYGNNRHENVAVRSGEAFNSKTGGYYFLLNNRISGGNSTQNRQQLVKKITFTISSDTPELVTTSVPSGSGWKKVSNPGDANVVAVYETENPMAVVSLTCPVEIFLEKSETYPVKITLLYHTEYYDNGTASTYDSSDTPNFYQLPEGEKLFVNWWYTYAVAAVNNDQLWGGSRDVSAYVSNCGQGIRTGHLGYVRFGNVGSQDSKPKYIEVDFSAAEDRIGVSHLQLQTIDIGDAVTIYYKTTDQKDDEWQEATLNTSLLGSGWFDREHLGITVNPDTNEPYIRAVKYPAVIPAKAQEFYVYYNGSILDESEDPYSVMFKIYNQGSDWNQDADPWVDSIVTRGTVPKAAELGITNIPTSQRVMAGEQIHLFASVGPADTSWMAQVPERIIYLISDQGLPFATNSLKIYSDAYGTYLQEGVDYTVQTGNGVFKSGGSAVPYMKITMQDTLPAVPGIALIRNESTGKVEQKYNSFQFSWALQTEPTTKSLIGSCEDAILVDLPYADGIVTCYLRACEEATDTGDIKSTTQHGALIKPLTSGTYEVVGLQGVGVVLNAKEAKESDYQAATANNTPVVKVGSISNSPSNTMDMKLVAVNNNTNALTQSASIYFPIPKKDQKWEALSNSEAFDFNMELAGVVTATSSVGNMGYQVQYSTSTNLHNLSRDELAKDSTFSATPPQDLSSVTCLKLMTADNLPVKATQEFSFKLLASDGEATGMNTLSAVYFQVADTFAGWTNSYPVQAAAMTGALSGSLFADTHPLNGLKDSTESAPANATAWTISIVDRSNGETEVATAHPAANGAFAFDLLAYDATGSRYRLKATNPTADKSWYFAPVAQGGNVVVASSDHSTAQTNDAFALKTDGSATYLVGVVENTDANKTTVTFVTDEKYGLIQNGASTVASLSQTGIYTDPLAVPTVNAASDPKIIEKPGYTFSYWADANNQDATSSLQNATLGVQNATYTAVWTTNGGYTVVYDTAGGTPASISSKTNVSWTDANLLPAETVTRDGYTLLGWFCGAGDTAVEVKDATTYAALAGDNDAAGSSITLVAKWRKNASSGSDDISNAGAFASVTVNLTGINPPATNAGKFGFTITPEGNSPVPSVETVYVSTLASGTDANTVYGLSVENAVQVGFGSITFTEPGMYVYTIRQAVPADADKQAGYGYDTSTCTLTVTATPGENASGEAELELSYATTPGTGLSFTNSYQPSMTGDDAALPLVEKVVTGKPTQTLDFTFTLTAVSAVDENGNKIMDASKMPIPADTTLTLTRTSAPVGFGAIEYARPGIYTYTVTEDVPAVPYAGYTYDKTVYTIVDTITDDNGANKLTSRVVSKGMEKLSDEDAKILSFTNSFDPAAVVNYFLAEDDTKAWKTVNTTWASSGLIPSEAPARENHTFLCWYYKDGAGNKHAVTESTLYSDLVASDDMLTANLYALWRKNAEFGDEGTGGDVSDPNGEGKKLALVRKVLVGNKPVGSVQADFAFTIEAGTYTAPAGSTVSATVPMPAATTVYVSTREGTNTEITTFGLSETTPQEVRFGSIGFSQPGTYTYLIKEQPGNDPHYVYDPTTYTMTVVVDEKEDQNGDLFLQLQTVQYSADGKSDGALAAAVFTNEYSPEVATAPLLQVQHVIDGEWSEQTTFQFQLVPVADGDGKLPPMPENDTVIINGQGTAMFDQWRYRAPGTYVYTVKALPSGVAALATDTRQYTVIDTVSDNGGSLVVSREIKGLKQGQNVMVFTTIAPANLPATGDKNEPLLWFAMMVISFGTIFVALRKKRA